MNWDIIHLDETDSTNRWLKQHGDGSFCVNDDLHKKNRPLCVLAEYQTAGRGCGTNTWESERGKNLLFSVCLTPKDIPANRQFAISMAVSLAICEALGQYIGDLSIKWPNDIYWRNGKIGGILIENTLQGRFIKESIIGVGLNINQREFHSDAPNPVSLWQISGQETDREKLLKDILQALDRYLGHDVKPQYLSMLYRRKGFHPYTDNDGAFMAEIEDVEDDGQLVLRDDSGQQRRYHFKEVQFVI